MFRVRHQAPVNVTVNIGAFLCHWPRLPYDSPHEINHRLIEELDRAFDCRRAEVYVPLRRPEDGDGLGVLQPVSFCVRSADEW